MSERTPALTVRGPRANARAVVLVLPGGSAESTAAATRGPSYLRVVPFAWAAARALRGRKAAVWLLRYRLRGWNGEHADPVPDARWALAQARRRHPGAPVVLVGHSMGGRVALRLAADPDVAAVCALAPWVPPGEPVVRPAAATVLIAHGDRDRMTDPAASARYAARIGASFVPVPGDGHAMLRRPLLWNRLVAAFVATAVGAVHPR